jgi:heme/copper-type cytochrome/quinol oxidase subunit 3
MSVPAVGNREVARAAAARRAKPNGWWAMLCVVATEGALFGCFVASYFYLRFRADHWPPPNDTKPALAVPLVLMAVLVTTSLPMHLASVAAANGRLRAARLGLFASFFVGSGYLAMQMWRFRESLQTARPEDSAYDSLVYLLTGGHHLHVLVGLLLDLYLLARLTRGLTNYRAVGVQCAALYWHFVNVLAVVVTLTTLSPSL